MTDSTFIKSGDYDSLVEYIRNRLKNNSNRTKNKYLVILHGPPSSGKSHATMVACRLIYDYFEKDLTPEKIKSTFLNTNVDDLTYHTITKNNIPVKQELLDNMYSVIHNYPINYDNENEIKKFRSDTKKLDPTKEADVEFVTCQIGKLVSSSYEIYRMYRPDNISEIMFYLSVFMNLNIYLETSLGEPSYIRRVVESLKYYGYIPIIVYPFVADVKIIYDRSIRRGIVEGRFLNRDGPFGLSTAMSTCLNNYQSLIKIISEYEQYAHYQYDSNYPNCDEFLLEIQNLENKDFFNKHLLDIGIKNYLNPNINPNFVGTNSMHLRTRDYGLQTKLII